MTYEDLLYDKEGGVVTLTLNVPEKLNPLTYKMRNSLQLATAEIARDDEVRAVILTGAGRGFSSGADVGAQRDRMSTKPTDVSRQELIAVLGDFSLFFPRLSKPVIAAINGACVGAGLSVAMSTDIRIAADTAKFGAAFINRGLIPDSAMTYSLPHAVGTSKALEFLLTGDLILAPEAERLGIVSKVVPAADLMKTAKELAVKIAQQPPIAVELTKKLVWRYMVDDMAKNLDLETWAQRLCWLTEDHHESVRAFLAKEPRPQYKGK